MSLTIAELFSAQSRLALDDPEGPHTSGSPAQVADWLYDHVVASTCIEPQGRRPPHHILDLKDGSAVTIVSDNDQLMRVAPSQRLSGSPNWSAESDAWVRAAGQPGAERYRESLQYTINSAPHPAEAIKNPGRPDCRTWNNTLLEAMAGNTGEQAHRAAQQAWDEIQQRQGALDS